MVVRLMPSVVQGGQFEVVLRSTMITYNKQRWDREGYLILCALVKDMCEGPPN